ncbi:cytochrome [Sesamum angolense]|uniref:Cytochrome n=1 Tax=Sesamum angolense TaxID=2727404 RepID=A0AAE2C6S5_9LAMI|nr:cytochrome [Sesamum angolense]
MDFSLLLLVITLGFLILSLLSSSSLLFNKLHIKLRNFALYSSPRIGCLIAFYKNRHRLLDWYTKLLSQSDTMTIFVHRLGAPSTIVTAKPDNVEYILKTISPTFQRENPLLNCWGIFNVDGEMWSIQRKLASHVIIA